MRGEPDNPDQRIAEDIRLLIEQSLELLLSLLKNIARFFSFIVILWQLSGGEQQRLSLPGRSCWPRAIGPRCAPGSRSTFV
ncbi:hypothetical protein [Brenneria nigrifluens]|uniref:hypothetical protein n=1 Tax=Brenneria nigrifluens TaxID=55210 RepID=UPI003CCC7EB0